MSLTSLTGHIEDFKTRRSIQLLANRAARPTNWIIGTTNEIDVTDAGGGTVSIGLVNPLIVSKGGTGAATLTTAFGLLAAGTTATGPVQTLAAGATTQILVGGGASALPAWGSDLPTGVTIGAKYVYRSEGTDVAVTDGGTGVSTLTTAYGLLAAGTTPTGTIQTLAAGGTTQILVGGGSSALPTWGTDLPTSVTIGSAYIYRVAGTDIPVTDGGTGVSTLTTPYGLLVAGVTATGAVQTLAAGVTTQILVGGGTLALPTWGTDLPTAVTIGSKYIYRIDGTDVPVADGGTGVSTLTTPYGLLAAGTTATGTVQTLVAGVTTQILVGGGASALPAWGTDLPTAVTIGSAYIYRAAGTDVPVTDGGTGLSAFAVGDIVHATGATTLAGLADVAVGSYLRSGGGNTVPLWSTLILPNATTAYRLPIATSANTIGELAAAGATGEYLKGNTGAIPSWAVLNQAAVAGLTTADIPQFLSASIVASGTYSFITQKVFYDYSDTNYFFGSFARGTQTSPAIVHINDVVWQISAQGYDGSTFQTVAAIKFGIDATPGTGDVAGNMLFTTTSPGGIVLTNRLGIDSAGVVTSFGKIRANTGFNFNGTNGVTQATGSPSDITTAGGIVTAITIGGAPNFSGLTVDTNTISVDATNHRVGVGTTVPIVQLDVFNASSSATNNPGNSQIRASALMGANAKFTSLGYDETLNAGYIQAAEKDVAWRNLVLEPNGGIVIIGKTSGAERLEVAGKIRADTVFNCNGTDGVTQAASAGKVSDVTAIAGGIATAQTQITYAADGTYTPVTSIKIANGRITAIS